MKIELQKIPIRDVVKDYIDNAEEWVYWYGWKLNIRPKYQREFVYDSKKRAAVIDSIRKNFPLNVMYRMKNEDWTFEILDWQQRTISICQYINWDFSLNEQLFEWLTEIEKNQILSILISLLNRLIKLNSHLFLLLNFFFFYSKP